MLFLLALPGCATGYLVRAAYEEARLLWRREPIPVLLQHERDPEVRAKLELTLAVRDYARDELGLAVGGSYRSVTRVDADQIVHVVTAALRDQLVLHTWWFPVVGRVPYRAYFDPADAEALAAELERDGFDTYVRPALAFSTLGWFDDPLPSPLLRYDEERLAETIIHELLHATIYLPGQAAFNESFATFVGHRGSEAFFQAAGEPERAARCAARWDDALTFSTFLGGFVDRLERAYAQGCTEEERAALFAAARVELATQPWRTGEQPDWATTPLNNAVILHDRLYADRLALFDDAYSRWRGDLRATIGWIRAVVAGRDDAYAALEAALGSGSADPD